MNTTLWMLPAPHPPTPITLNNRFKKVIAHEYWGHDGSHVSQDIHLSGSDTETTSFFAGIVAAAPKEIAHSAQLILKALEDYGEIKIYIAKEESP